MRSNLTFSNAVQCQKMAPLSLPSCTRSGSLPSFHKVFWSSHAFILQSSFHNSSVFLSRNGVWSFTTQLQFLLIKPIKIEPHHSSYHLCLVLINGFPSSRKTTTTTTRMSLKNCETENFMLKRILHSTIESCRSPFHVTVSPTRVKSDFLPLKWKTPSSSKSSSGPPSSTIWTGNLTSLKVAFLGCTTNCHIRKNSRLPRYFGKLIS